MSRLACHARAALLGALAIAACAAPASAAKFAVAPIDLGSGFSLQGFITTDGTVGDLTAGNITGWGLKVTSIQDIVYTPANTHNISTGVTAAGGQLRVAGSPDGVDPGGSLRFYGGPHFQVSVADFDGLNAAGGQAFYVAGAAFDFVDLNNPNGVDYVAATASGLPGVFDLTPRAFSPGVVMNGTITTDGVDGAANILDWTITVRETQSWLFTPANSHVVADAGLHTDGQTLAVTALDAFDQPGSFLIGGFGGFEFNGVVLGDFTSDPGGIAGYISPFAYQVVSPLPLDSTGSFVVGQAAVPEPAVWSLMIAGFGLAGAAMRRRRTLPAA